MVVRPYGEKAAQAGLLHVFRVVAAARQVLYLTILTNFGVVLTLKPLAKPMTVATMTVVSQKKCDAQLKFDIRSACLKATDPVACNLASVAYYVAVFFGGSEAFNNARSQCTCKQN